MKKKIISVICVACFLISCCVALTGCKTVTGSGVSEAKINEDGELIVIYQDGTKDNLGVVVGKDGSDGKDGSNTATTGSESDVSAASAKGLLSAVSIVCNFQTSVQQGGWRPGSSSSSTQDYSSAGSGVIYQLNKEAGDAFIITNYHVVYDASNNTKNGISNDISVYLYGSTTEDTAIKATYVGGSPYYDIAVLHIDNSDRLKSANISAVAVADSDKVVVGGRAIAIGNAKGYGISVSSGVVSVDSEYITMSSADEKSQVSFRVIRVDTAVNSGNSGGGLFDGNGNLIGIVNAKIVDDGVENIGYAIPSNVATSIADNIIDYCFGTDVEQVQRALLGISVLASDSKAVYDSETGLLVIEEKVSVYEIDEDSIVKGLFQQDDVFVSITLNGQKKNITRQYHVIDMMLNVRVGDVVTFEILRGEETLAVDVTITEACLTAY